MTPVLLPLARILAAATSVTAVLISLVSAQSTGTFSVAAWNIQGGTGTPGFLGNAGFTGGHNNCTDRSKALNAWGVDVVQPVLAAAVKSDASVVAFAAEEAWGCAEEKNLNGVLGFKAVSPGRNGTVLIARHGIKGTWDVFQIERAGEGGMKESRFLVGGNVCLDAGCRRTMWMWATHLAPAADRDWPAHVKKVLDYLANKPTPHIVMGDFNSWRNDQWSPETNCGTATAAMGEAWRLIDAAGYVDAWKVTQSGEGWTGMQSRRGCGEDRKGDLFKRIDYVLLKGAGTFVSTERFGRVMPGAPAPSDHVGLKATLRIPGDRHR